ncbi:hypothetical protein SUGI_1009080 [Cryptomeria japonica]|nr:hypothetical protein SUGI_1009080 [Cryptomeria japonica]
MDSWECSCAATASNTNPVRAGYWPWDANSYMPTWNINASLYTHLFYAFVDLDNQTFTVTVPQEQQQIFEGFSATVQEVNSSVKTLISIGGGSSNATLFSIMASNSSLRKSFIDSSIALARDNGFHGLDLDWEFPATRTDMDNFGYLLDEWRDKVHLEALTSGLEPLLLTAAVYFSEHFFDGESRDYPIQIIADNLDWINVMCFDYHGSWDTSHTGAHSALYDVTSHLSTNYGIGSWLDSGIPPNKVVMGIPMYGRSWMLKNKEKVRIGSPAVAAGPRQRLSNQTGFMMFSEVDHFIRKHNATVVIDNFTVSAYCYAGDVWISYDDKETVDLKTKFAKDRGLLGYFFWAVSYDHNWTLSTQASDAWDRYCIHEQKSHSFISPVAAPSYSPSLSPSTGWQDGSSNIGAMVGSARSIIYTFSSLSTSYLLPIAIILLLG